MRPVLEHLPVPPDASWAMLNRRLDAAIPFQWHHHPEYELTLTLNSRGQRFVGDHVGTYSPGDLVLVGPNLPHTWASRERTGPGPHVALVLWFRADWMASVTAPVELRPVAQMFARAAGGLSFDPALGLALPAGYEALFALPPAPRLIALLALLSRLAGEPAQPLSATAPPPEGDRSRIDRVLAHLHQHYPEPLRMEDLARIAALSVSGLHRLFRRHVRMSVTDYIAALRVGEACSRLSSTRQPISHIAAEVGYPSLANFNRQFLRLRSMTPRDYRASFR